MRTIFHVDVNNAFLSWTAVEQLKKGVETDLRQIPAVIAYEGKNGSGIVLAKSPPAKKAGVVTAEVLWQARRKCPDLVVVPPDFSVYVAAAKKMRMILSEYSPLVEPFSIDECFLDMSGSEKLFGPAEATAHALRERIFKELGFTVNIGIAATKVAAKMASDFEKPNRVHTLYPEEIPKKLWPLPIDTLFMAGKSSVKSFRHIGIRTVGDLAKLPEDTVTKRFGANGALLWRYAHGIDPTPVDPQRPAPKSVSKGITFYQPLARIEDQEAVLLSLAEEVAYELADKKMWGNVIGVAWKDKNLKRSSRQKKYDDLICHYTDIFQRAKSIFTEARHGNDVKYLCVEVSGLTDEKTDVGNLFATDEEKNDRLAETIHDLKEKYGKASIMSARTLGGNVPRFSRRKKDDENQRE